MKHKIPYFLITIGILLVLFAYYKKSHPRSQKDFTPSTTATESHKNKKSQINIATHSEHKSLSPQEALLLQKKTSTQFLIYKNKKKPVEAMSYLLKHYAFNSYSVGEIINHLKEKNMNPILLKESNPYTGTMHVVRTESPLPNTRYFHAQFFEDQDSKSYLQHMSFDIKPGAQAFETAIQTVKSIFTHLRAPQIVKPNFIMWSLNNGYNLWIQRLQPHQLSGDPYNAYDARDNGTVKIALELDLDHNHEHKH